jgi:hypothetical protein
MLQDFALVHELETPFSDGDQAVVSPLASIQDGMPVILRQAQAPEASLSPVSEVNAVKESSP